MKSYVSPALCFTVCVWFVERRSTTSYGKPASKYLSFSELQTLVVCLSGIVGLFATACPSWRLRIPGWCTCQCIRFPNPSAALKNLSSRTCRWHNSDVDHHLI